MRTKIRSITLLALFALAASTTWARIVTLQTDSETGEYFIEMPTSDIDTLVVPNGVKSFKVYDDGGKDGTYGMNVEGYLVVVAPDAVPMTVTGTVAVEGEEYDYLSIYDGYVDNSSLLLDKKISPANDVPADIGIVTSSGNVLILYFYADEIYSFSGLDLNVGLAFPQPVSVAPVSGGTISTVSQATVGSTVKLKATAADGYVLDEIVAYSDGTPIRVQYEKWCDSASFVMPDGPVTITPSFVPASDLSVNMPASGAVHVGLPAGVVLKVYDDGGSSGNYSNKASGYMRLTAPQGYVIRVAGSLTAEGTGTDNLTIFDGDSLAQKLLNAFAVNVNGATGDIGAVYSTDNVLTLFFKSDNTVNFAGLDLTVTAEDPSVPHNVVINSAVGGSITVNGGSTSVGVGSVVTLAATPEANMVLTGVSVLDGAGNPVPVTGGKWYSGNVASFVMPASDVSVTPEFANTLTADDGLYINMPTTGTQQIFIPDNVESFYLYDDGGKDGNYSNNVDGILEMVATEKTRLFFEILSTKIDSRDRLSFNLGNGKWSGDYLSGLSHLNKLGVKFHSDASANYAGFEILVEQSLADSVTMNQADGGTVACDKRFPGTDSVVTLTITPDAGYLLKGLSVVDGSGNPVIVNGLNSFSSSLTFTMPASSVTVTPEFTDDLTAAGGLVAHMPKTGVQTVEIPSGVQTFKLYDDGGKDGTYSSNAQGYLELVAPQGHVLQIAGTIVTQSSVDILTVYDGPYSSLASNPVMVAKSGSNDIDVLVSSENAVTLYFRSNASNEKAGLDLLVNLVDLSAEHVISVAGGITGGSLGTSLNSATSGTTVSLNATPDANCVLTGIAVTDVFGHKVAVNGGTWYAPVATFDMPGTDVTVTPTFEADVPLDNDFYINMPATGNLTVSIPAGMPAFKFYDDGGKNGRYTRGANGIVEMVAPEGYSILVTENELPAIYGSDYLYIYEGENLLARVGNSTRGIWESSGNTMKFVFASVGSGDHTGFNFTVTLVNPNASHEVVLAEAQGGTLSIENNIAACGSPVTVTAHPDDNYVLSNVVVADSIGRAVPVTEGAWYSDGTASFTMPCLAATVTPAFTNDLTAEGGLSVNMPKIGRRTIRIPEGITSFKVYDDGGENGNYSDGVDGWLELIAPDGYVLQVTGTRGTSAFDYPAIYDGLDTSVVLYDGRTVGDVAGSIGTYASSGNAMIIYFSSNAKASSSASYQSYLTGIDFTVDVVKLADKRSVTVSDGVTGGAVQLASTEFAFGTTVMLSTVPADGYMLAQIVATDEKGNSLKIEGDCVFENSCWFVMPNSNVTVTPTFVDDPTAENGLYTNMPKSGTRTISIPASVKSFKVYDDGGRDAPYSSNADGYLELIAPSGYIMQVAGSVYMAEIGSHVQIYDGATVDFDKRLVLLEQSKSIDGYVESSGEVLTLYLHTGEESAGSSRYGANLTVTLVNKDVLHAITVADGITNGSVSVDLPNAKYGTPITVTTTPADGYFLKELSITANGEPVKFDGGTWFGSNVATFNMPSSDVSISAEFVSSATADDGLYINMLENATRYATIPSGVSSFKVYDDGGKDGSYSIGSSGADDYLQLTAPAGYVMQVTGTVKTYNAMQYLTIYDGESSSTTKLLDNKYGSSDTDIGTLTSTGGVITLYFHAGNYMSDGFDLTVTMVPTNEIRHVTVSSAENGTLLANNDDVEIGTVVTLTASPADGFVLSENMTIQGCNGDEISFSGGWYTNNQVSFVMPGCDVTVTPVFDSERFVKMPLKGVKYVQLPEGVTSLKIYDDGGKDGYYGVSADGYIVVTAPDGSVFSTSGSVRINNRGDYITIVDGDLSASMTSADRRSGSFNLVNQISSSNVLTFHLVSDKTICDAGLDLALTVFDVGNTHEVTIADGVVGGTVSVSQTPAALGEVVELTATPAEDYFLVGVSAVDGEGNNLTITDGLWFTGNKATFTMPYSDVTFTPTFVTGMTEDEARYINMPTAGKKIINIPAGTPAFHVYDDGGKDGDYSLNADGYIVLKAPEGYVFQLTGSEFDWDSYNGFLQLYDSDTTDSGKEFFQMSTSTTAMSTKRSAGNVLTIRFSTRNYGQAGGFDIIVSLVDANEKQPITVTDGGSFNMLERGWIAATVPEGVSSFHVYDDGGASENYGGHDSSYVELIAPQGHVFVVSGNIDTDGYNLTLFDGDTSSKELYTKAQGDVVEGLISASNVMTLYFRSSCTPVACQTGFDLDITVMDASVPHTVTTLTGENGSVELSGASERYFRDTITYVANAEEGYYFVGLDVMAGDNQISVILDNAIDQNRSVAKFVMPNTDVSVTPIFMAVANQYSGFYVTTPVTGYKTVAIPAGITSFKVYDDGGMDADCSKGATGILELTAPEGYVFKMTGSLTIQKRSVCSGEDYCRNFLKIRNGTVENLGNDLVYSQSTYQQMNDPTVYDLGTLTSTGNTITVELHTNEEIYNNQNNNLDMSVELEFVGIVYHVSFDMESLQTNSTYYAIGHGDIWKNSNTTMDIILSDKAYDLLHLYEFVPDAIPYFNRYAWSPTPDVSSPPLVSYALTDNVVNAANINASSPRNFMVYAAPDPSPETVAAAELMVHPYNGTTRMTDAADFHGQVVLSQTWGVKTFSQTSETKTSDDDGTNYLSLMVPSPTTYSDTLVYNVNFAPEPGYVMSIPSDPEPFTTTWMHDGEMLAAPPTGEGWGYDASAKTLKILPRFMPDMVLKVNYALAHYDLKFDQPLPESGVFVTNNESGSAIDWFETSSNKTFETATTPTVYDANGCRVAWKVKDRSVTSRSDAGIAEELPYMVPLEDDANALNEFELDLQHPVCDNPGSGTGPVHVQTLQIEEGLGKIMLVQNIGVDPSQQITIEHEFVSGQMNVPVHLNGSSEEVGVPLTVVVVPEPGYVLKQLTYDMTVDGSPVTVLVEDGATINVKQDLAWRAKFVDFEPVYVTYDLQLGPDDSSKVWIPTNATLSEEIVIPADGSAYEMWEPSREGYFFDGWTKDPNDNNAATFTYVDSQNSSEFSNNAARPTQLYAKFRQGNIVGGISNVVLRYYDDIDQKIYSDVFDSKDTLVVTQKLGNVVFEHKITYSNYFFQNPHGYKVSFGVLPVYGHELADDEIPQVVMENYDYSLAAIADNGDGTFTLGAGTASSAILYAVGYREKGAYKVALSPNAGDAVVAYGEHWTKSVILQGGASLPVGSVFRKDACFAGWSFEPEMNDLFYYEPEIDALDASMLQERANRLAMGLDADTLYARWNSNSDCRNGIATISLADDFAQNATVSLYQMVDGAEVKVIEVGNTPVEIPFGVSSYQNQGPLTPDGIAFSRIEITPKPGATLDNNYQLTYVKVSDPQTSYDVSGNNFVFDENIEFRLQGLVKHSYDVVYHENAGDANVFYGENWNAEVSLTTDDPLSYSLYRADKCVAGWSFEGDQTKYRVADAEFVAAYEAHVAAGTSTDLYAVWSDNVADCGTIETFTVSLSNDLKGISTVELIQTVGGEPKVVATVGEDGISIPKMQATVMPNEGMTLVVGENGYFSGLRVVPAPGYELVENVNPSYKIGTADAVEVTDATPAWLITDATELSGAVASTGYTIAFNENAGNTNVFYPADWSETGSYNIVDNDGTVFPKLYRTDKCLVGYGFNKDASRDQSFQKFDTTFVMAYDSVVAAGVASPVLYGVWNECTQALYTVTLNDIAEGTLVLSHNGKAYNVPSTGFVVPEATPALEFGLAFTPNLGYKLADEGSFNLVNESGVIQSVVENNTLAVDGDKIVDAPVATLENTFAFVTNAGNAVLFYGDDWVESALYSLDAQNVDFPKGIYRVDSCFKGWALNTESDRTHLQFNTEFLDDVEATRNAGLPVDRLYAIWGACETEQTIVTVANADSLSGTFMLSRTVSQTAKTYTVAGTALQVPADEALTFAVTFVPNKGYTYDETVGITAVDATDVPVSMNAGELVVATSLTLSAAATADTYAFALNENAGDANVFYTGSLATEFTAKMIDDAATRAFPMNLYRSDACLEGWNFSTTAMVGFSQLDDEFVDAYNDFVAAGNDAPTTLYAVWNENCHQTLYTVSSFDKRKGTLTLAQGSREFVVDTAGLKVPSVAGGLAFTATFTPAVGYDYDATQGLEAFNNMSQSMGVLTDGALTVTKTTVLKAVSLTASTYELAFNVNAGNATVYYGDAWRAGTEQTSFSFADAGDFPSDIYRTDSCLAGWTLSTSATAGVFTEFSGEFVDSVATMDNFDGKLFAKWGNCIAVNNVTVAQVTSAAGTLTLKQTDALGNTLNTINIDDAEVTLPLGDGDVTFDVSFTVGEGYSLVDGDYFYTVNANGKNVQALLGNKLTLSGNTLLRAPVLSDAYTITFNTNAGDANVFYGAGWASEGQYAMEMSEVARTFPTEVYRVGYTLAGWSLTPAENSGVGDYMFNTDLATALKESGKTQVTLYAVWAAATSQQTYTITLADADAGYVTATQNVGKTTASFRVGEEGLEVPAVTGGLAFDVTATMNAGYFADGEKLYLLAAGGVRVDSLARENGELVVDGNKIVEIPYESDGAEFAFSVNTDAHVFYEDGWTGSGAFALNGDTAFPTGILRTEGKLLGWALSRTSTKYYSAYNGTFVKDLKNYKALGLPTGTLYAVWNEYGLFDNVNVTNGNDKNGSFVITQTVNGVETEPITVNADGIQIPYSEKGLTFNVKFETKPGYYLNAEQAISGANAAGASIGNAVNGGALVFKSNTDVVLSASVDANRLKFNYNVNGGDAYVFYGSDWSSTGEKSLNDTSLVFPANIYRNDACLQGWSIDPADSTGSTLLTSDFIATLDRVQNVNTLYAVWKECEVETYTVTFENTNVGSLVLSQDVDDSLVTFAVAEDGLKVPVVPGGLRFRAAYTLNAGYAGNTDTLYVVDDITGILTTLADNALTVNENITLAIPTVGETFKLVFDVNREGRLFYGSDWIDSAIYMLSDKKSVIPLPNYVYTSEACMVGWSVERTGGETYLKFNTDLAAALLENKSADSTYKLYAIWGKGADCDDLYDRVTFTGNHGTVHLAEAPRGDKTEFIEHEFMSDGTMILPKTMNGNYIRVFAVPDSSYMLDSLVMTRNGSDEERQVFFEGDALVYNLMDAQFEAFFGKSNRTEVAFVKPMLTLSGNAMRFSFTTSMYEITRKVGASVRLETIDGELVDEADLLDSIVPPYNGKWEKFPLAAGRYVLKATIGDDRETDVFDTVFDIVAEIAAVSENAWQMISIGNLDKDAMVWDGDAIFYWWDEASASGEYWQYREYDPNDDIVPTRGYWYSSIEGRPLVLKAEVEETVADKVEWKLDNVNSGWNLVANPYGFALNLYGDHPAENVEASEESGVTFWSWNPEIADYEQVDVVSPYGAVWVKVAASTDWTIPVAPEFVTANEDTLEEAGAEEKALNKSRGLLKANSKNDWRIQAVLSDAMGHLDAWNLLGASSRPFVTEEPPAGMGNHVNLSVMDGTRRLAKSVKAPAEEQEWTISLVASSERYGYLKFNGVNELNAFGLKLFVTVDGKTTEMHDGMELKVALKSSATKATVRVAKGPRVVADLHIDGLRSVQSGSSLNVSFVASADLAGTRTVVEILNMDGKVLSSRSATTLAGTNALALDAPRGGMYLLRVRAGSQMKAGRIIVR